MTRQRQSPESWVRQHATSDRMSEIEAELAWVEIWARLTEEPESAATATASGQTQPLPRPFHSSAKSTKRRRLAPLAVAGSLAATVLLAYALLPVGSDPERSTGGLSAGLESASATVVLQVAADSAVEGRSLMPGAGEVLYWRTVTDHPNGGAPSYHRRVQEWVDGKGRGRRVETYGAGTRERDRTVTEFTADRPDPSIGLGESWRSLFGITQLTTLPAAPDALLARLRAQVLAEAGQNSDLGEGEDELFGVDFITLISAVQLLGQAPLDGGQRAALFEVLIDAPRWFRADGAAAISIRNLGVEATDDGREGNRLRVAMDIEPGQTGDSGVGPGVWELDLIVDPIAGELIAMNEYEFDADEPEVTTIRELKVMPAPEP